MAQPNPTTPTQQQQQLPPTFYKERHIKYFLRCLKTFLPQGYLSNDSNRMTLAFFTLAGLDLLGILNSPTVSEADRAGYINWVYHCQVPSSGGFRGFSGTDFTSDKERTPENECWDPANVPATFFALTILLVLGDDLARVKRRECLRWLRKCQREDGSFGEILGPNGRIEGDRDLRFCCCAAGIRFILRGKDSRATTDAEEDIDVGSLVSYVKACQAYDGGFAGAPGNESHAGLTYCALGTLSFLGLLPKETCQGGGGGGGESITASRYKDLVGWLVYCQTSQLHEEENSIISISRTELSGQPSSLDERIASLPIFSEGESPSCAGFNGRINKTADTCYCFWVTGSLAMTNRLNVADATLNRNFLLGKTQHLIGGFGKGVGAPPDILHSYLGLASLGLFGEADLDEVDPTFCTSKRTRQHLESLPWWRGS